MAENELEPPVLGVSWDGTGYGLDGTVWGGEFFFVNERAWRRVAHLRPFHLPGGDKAVKEPRRAALGLLYGIFGEQVFDQKNQGSRGGAPASTRGACAPLATFSASEFATLGSMLARAVNSPLCTSVGRLFDAVASLTGLRQQIGFEGQAAMELEFASDGIETEEAYPLPIADCRLAIQKTVNFMGKSEVQNPKSEMVLDWSPMTKAILADLERGVPVGEISAKFHNALVEGIVAVARRVGQPRVVLSGGCFQNRYLTERTVKRLSAEGFQPYWHQRVPPNDGGIALGQVVASMRAFAPA